MVGKRCVLLSVAVACVALTAEFAGAREDVVRLFGADFEGGAAEVFGAAFHGVGGVNYVYAEPTGPLGAMCAPFDLEKVPEGGAFLHLRARDDDAGEVCSVEILLNGVVLFCGESGFPSDQWLWKRYAIPEGALKAGRNELAVFNREPTGAAGMPPWFMVAEARIAGEDEDPRVPRSIAEDFYVTLPESQRQIPAPPANDAPLPGFRIRGIKGWSWSTEQYLAEIPFLAEHKMNFLMNCYLSMFSKDEEARASGMPNRWWEPIPEAQNRAYEEVVSVCRHHGVQFCFAMHPSLASSRSINYGSREDRDALWQHYEWMVGIGVEWFCICLDDIVEGVDADGQAQMVNEFLRRLRARNPKAELIVCPTYYWGVGDDPQARGYLEILAEMLDPDVYLFWTGSSAVCPAIQAAAAEQYRHIVKHQIIIWDNYPVNDAHPTLHLGPVTGRDPELCRVAEGYMANTMFPQTEINRLPLLTAADYAYNPAAYDPAGSIRQAILCLSDAPVQCQVFKDLVELYPGMLVSSHGTRWNPVVTRFSDIIATPHSKYLADMYLTHVEDVATRLRREFPGRFEAAHRTIVANLATMRTAYADKYGR